METPPRRRAGIRRDAGVVGIAGAVNMCIACWHCSGPLSGRYTLLGRVCILVLAWLWREERGGLVLVEE